jgi:8-oxo-dGTP diphosphatase
MSKMLLFPQSETEFNVALSLSLVLFGFDGKNINVLIAKSNNPDFKGQLFLPSRNLNAQEDFKTVSFEMFEILFGYTPALIEQLRAFDNVCRSTRGRVVNVPHFILVKTSDFLAEEWEQHGMHWCPINKVPQLAFDHNEMIEFARHRLDRRVKRRPVGFKMLPPEFTIGQLIRLYEIAIRKKIDKRNFRKKLFKTDLLKDLDKKADGKSYGQQKGSQLFSFNILEYREMKKGGYPFQF